MNSCTNNFGSNFLSSSSRFTLSIISPPNNHKLSICFFTVFLASPLSIINSMNVINTDSTILFPHLISCLTIFQLSGYSSSLSMRWFDLPITLSSTQPKCQMPPPACRARSRCRKSTARTSRGCMCRRPWTICLRHRSTEGGTDEWESHATPQYVPRVISRHRVPGRTPRGQMVRYRHRCSKICPGTRPRFGCTSQHSVSARAPGYVDEYEV